MRAASVKIPEILSHVRNTSPTTNSGQFGDGDAAFNPQGVHGTKRRQPVLEVAELLTVHKHTEAAALAPDLQLRTHIHPRQKQASPVFIQGF